MPFKCSKTCEDLAESLWDKGFWESMFSEDYWSDSFTSTRYLERLEQEAKKLNIQLIDTATWDYDRYFWNLYKACSDKGL